jgi:hypothetical protein
VKITPKLVETKFQKLRGKNIYAKTWGQLSNDSQASILHGVVLDDDEVPVVAITAPPNPVVITTKQIVWRTENSVGHVLLNHLRRVEAPQSLQEHKLHNSKLLLLTHSGESYPIETVEGETLFILWNLLLKLITLTNT